MDINSYINSKNLKEKVMRNLVILVMMLFGTVNGVFGQGIVMFADNVIEAHPGEQVIIFEGEIMTEELITLDLAGLSFQSSVDLSTLVSQFTLTIGNTGTAMMSPSGTNGIVNFLGTFQIVDTVSVRLVAYINSTASLGEFTLEDLGVDSWQTAVYTASGENIEADGHVSHKRVRIVEEVSVLTIVRTDALVDRDVLEGAEDELMLSLQVYNSGEAYEISQLEFTAFGFNSEHFNDNVTAVLYMNGNPIRITGLYDGKMTFPNLNIESNEIVDLNVVLDFDYAVMANDELWLEMTKVFDGNSLVVDVPVVISATITIIEPSVIVQVSPMTPEAMLLVPGEDYTIATINFTAQNAGIILTDLYLHNFLNLEMDERFSNIRFHANDFSAETLATSVTSEGIAFTNISDLNFTFFVSAETTKSFDIIVSVNDVIHVDDLMDKDLVCLRVSDEDFTPTEGTINGVRAYLSENGMLLTNVFVWSDPISNWHKVVKNMPIFVKEDFDVDFEESNSNMMKFSVTNLGSGDMVLEALFINLSGVTEGSIKLYAETIHSDFLITTVNYDADALSYNSYNQFTEGETKTYYIVLDNSVGVEERVFEIASTMFTSMYDDGLISAGDYEPYREGTLLPISETYDQGTAPVKTIGNGDGYSKFVVYPNPVSNILNISNFENADHAELYDMFGKKVRNIYESQVDVSSLINGVYIIRFIDSDSRVSESMSIIKQ